MSFSKEAVVQKGKIFVEIVGIKNSKGTMRIGVYNKKDKLWDSEGTFTKADGKINDGKCVIAIDNLPYGNYALALMHDENDNLKMDYNWIGIPNEGFGFSKNPKVVLSAPSFEETAIELICPVTSIKIKLKYM